MYISAKILKQQITKKIENRKTVEQIKEYLKSEDSLEVFQWELFNNLLIQPVDLNDNTVAWIINDKDALETLVTSGDIDNDKWKEAIDILAEIIRQDPNAKKGLKLKLAVAVALTFSNDVISMADGSSIDGIARYHNYVQWADEGVLFEPFYNLNAWQMRYVVGSWAQDEELIWARANALEEYRNPMRIGSVTHKMVSYNLVNKDGISVHSSDYYYGKPVTLEWIHTIGGVCGSISKFGTGMAQAFGIPGLPVGQPGHCAFIWLYNGTTWYLDNDVSGWATSSTHGGIQYTWKKPAPFFTMMDEAQQNPHAYRLSEKIRVLADSFDLDSNLKFSLLEDATSACPQNYDLWNDLKKVMSEQIVDDSLIDSTMLPDLMEIEKRFEQTKNVAWKKPVAVSAFQNLAHIISDGNGNWWSDEVDNAWVEIDLGSPCTIDELSIRWWGISYSDDYDVLALIDNKFVKVGTRNDEDRQSTTYNPLGKLPGWSGRTTKVRFEMRSGNKDPWFGKYYFGIRHIIITGHEHHTFEMISHGRPVSTYSIGGITSTGKDLVDGDLSTYWVSNPQSSWNIAIKLQGICLLDSVEIKWVGSIQGRQTLQCFVGGLLEAETNGKFTKVEMQCFAKDLELKLRESNSYSIREVDVYGYCYSIRDIFKMKLPQGFVTPETPYTTFIIEDVTKLIDGFECDSCF